MGLHTPTIKFLIKELWRDFYDDQENLKEAKYLDGKISAIHKLCEYTEFSAQKPRVVDNEVALKAKL